MLSALFFMSQHFVGAIYVIKIKDKKNNIQSCDKAESLVRPEINSGEQYFLQSRGGPHGE